MCKRARRKALTLQNIRSAWGECGIRPFDRVRVISNPKYSLPPRAHPESPPPRERRPLRYRPPPLRSHIGHLTAAAQVPPSSLDDSHNLIMDLRAATQKMEADLHVAKAELHQALTHEKSAQSSRAMLSKARYIRQGDLANARHARKEPGKKSGRKRKAGNSQREPEAKRTKLGQQATRNSNAGGCEV